MRSFCKLPGSDSKIWLLQVVISVLKLWLFVYMKRCLMLLSMCQLSMLIMFYQFAGFSVVKNRDRVVNSMALQIAQLLEKMSSSDKDYRFMATNDLMTDLQNDSIKLDDESERKVVLCIPILDWLTRWTMLLLLWLDICLCQRLYLNLKHLHFLQTHVWPTSENYLIRENLLQIFLNFDSIWFHESCLEFFCSST